MNDLNSPIDNTQSSVNTAPISDFNTTPAPSTGNVPNLVDDLTGMPAAVESNAPREEFPQEIPTNSPSTSVMPTDNVDQFQPTPMDTFQPSPSFDTTPTPMDTVQPAPSFDTTPTPMDTVQPAPSFDTTPTPMDTVQPAPSFDTTPTPMDTVQSAPIIEEASMMNTPQPETVAFENADIAAVQSPPQVETSPMAAPLSPQDLSAPLPDIAPPNEAPFAAFNETEIVNTLGEEKKEGKGGTVVVIVLIVVIIALLATIGYFAYKIFIA